MSSQYGELAAVIDTVVWGTPQRVSRLDSGTLVVGVSQTLRH